MEIAEQVVRSPSLIKPTRGLEGRMILKKDERKKAEKWYWETEDVCIRESK